MNTCKTCGFEAVTEFCSEGCRLAWERETVAIEARTSSIPNDHKRVTNQFGWSNGNPEVK